MLKPTKTFFTDLWGLTRPYWFQVTNIAQPNFAVERLSVALPNGRPLITPTDVTLVPRNSVLMTGPSGSGKSTLFHAFAGI